MHNSCNSDSNDPTKPFPCSTLGFTCKDFDIGYIPVDVEVIRTGVLSIKTTTDFPYNPLSIDVESQCTELKFPNGNGVYNQSIYSVSLTPDSIVYIPFAITATECGNFECEVTYEFSVFNEQEEEITCKDSTKVKAYVATCEWQECLTGNSRQTISAVYCNPEVDCSDDLCNNPALQKLAVMVGIDQAIRFKIEKKDWAQVDALFRRGIAMCDCTAETQDCKGEGCHDCKDCKDCGGDCHCKDKNKGGCNNGC